MRYATWRNHCNTIDPMDAFPHRVGIGEGAFSQLSMLILSAGSRSAERLSNLFQAFLRRSKFALFFCDCMSRELGRPIRQSLRCRRKRFVPKGKRWNLCVYRRDCTRSGVCNKACSIASCKGCARVRCNEVCPDYVERICELIGYAPYVCGDCHRSSNCGFLQADYVAVDAQLSYEAGLVGSREGISLPPSSWRASCSPCAGTCAGAGASSPYGRSWETCCRYASARCTAT